MQEFFNSRRTNVIHEILGDDLNGGTGVFQRLIQASARHGLGGDVAFIVDELKARKDARGKGRKIKIGELKGEGPVAGGNAVPIYRWVKERKK